MKYLKNFSEEGIFDWFEKRSIEKKRKVKEKEDAIKRKEDAIKRKEEHDDRIWRIKKYLNRVNLYDYSINDDYTVDVNGSVNIDFNSRSRYIDRLIPSFVQFGTVTGNFTYAKHFINSLKGCPQRVERDFICSENCLISLEGGPLYVGGDYRCSANSLTSLKGVSKEIGGGLIFNNNNITNLDYLPDKIGTTIICRSNPIYEVYELFGSLKAYKDSLDYNYWRGNNIIKLRFVEALEEIGKEAPNYFLNYRYI